METTYHTFLKEKCPELNPDLLKKIDAFLVNRVSHTELGQEMLQLIVDAYSDGALTAKNKKHDRIRAEVAERHKEFMNEFHEKLNGPVDEGKDTEEAE